MKIIHLSDTHLGRDGNIDRFRRLVTDIRNQGDPAEFVIIHTGDLIDKGSAEERDGAAAELAVLSDTGWQILLSPGNHDYGDAMRVEPNRAAAFRDKFARYIFDDRPEQFPVLTLKGDCALIGLDSNEGEMGWLTRWFAEGCLGHPQIDRLDQMLNSVEVRQRYVVLYMHHHPFFDAYTVSPDVDDGNRLAHFVNWNTRRFRRLKDAYSLMQCIRDRVDCMLFGHQHFGFDYTAEAKRYGVNLALDGSSSTCTDMDTNVMRYRVIDTATGRYQTRLVEFLSL